MRPTVGIALFLLASAWAAAPAQRRSDGRAIGVVIGVTRVDGRTGVSFPLTVGAGSGRLMGNVIAEYSLVPRSDGDRYRIESGRCRDVQTGEQVDDDLCDGGPDSEFAGAAEVTYALSDAETTPFVGAGYRFGWGTTPYATLGWNVRMRRTRLMLRGSVGDDFLQGAVGFYWFLR